MTNSLLDMAHHKFSMSHHSVNIPHCFHVLSRLSKACIPTLYCYKFGYCLSNLRLSHIRNKIQLDHILEVKGQGNLNLLCIRVAIK